MQRITPDSLRELNGQLDAGQLVKDLGSKRADVKGETLLADCPLEPGVKAVLTIEMPINFATCSSKSCPANQRRSLLWLYCKARGINMQDGAQELATQYDVLLEYESDEPKAPEAPKVIELVDAPPEIGPVESPSLRSDARRQDQEEGSGKKLLCPILKSDCVEDGCRWWVVDWIEEKHMYRRNCAVSLIAIGLTDESLMGGKKK